MNKKIALILFVGIILIFIIFNMKYKQVESSNENNLIRNTSTIHYKIDMEGKDIKLYQDNPDYDKYAPSIGIDKENIIE